MKTLRYPITSLGLLSSIARATINTQALTKQDLLRFSEELRKEAEGPAEQWYQDHVSSLTLRQQEELAHYIAGTITIMQDYLKSNPLWITQVLSFRKSVFLY